MSTSTTTASSSLNLSDGLQLSEKQFTAVYKEFLTTISGRHTMSARELCEIDDHCTTLVVDPLVRFKSHKMLLDYEPPSMQTHLLCLSIMMQFIYDGDILKVYRGLYSLKFTRDFLEGRSPKARQHFRDHLLRFIAMFRYDAGYTVSDCSRYAHEGNVGAKLISTKYWKKDDVIEMLVGVIGNLEEEEERELLVPGVNDFSVLMSQRKKKAQLWLGPGAFLNHDCNPNCQFLSNKINTATITVLRDLNPGDELFIFYGPAFFGENNCDCECQTCEKKGLGYYRPDKSVNVPREKNSSSPTPSMFSTYTLDEAGIYRKKKRALRKRKEISADELLFDAKDYFQKEILKRFINRPLITCTDNIQNPNNAVLENLQFNPKGLPLIETESHPSIELMLREFNGWENEVEELCAIEQHFPKPPKLGKDLSVSDYLSFLGFNVCILDQERNEDGKILNKKIVIGTSRPWEEQQHRLQWRSPVKVKPKNSPTKIRKFVSETQINSIIQKSANQAMSAFRKLFSKRKHSQISEVEEEGEEYEDDEDLADKEVAKIMENYNEQPQSNEMPTFDEDDFREPIEKIQKIN
uniref:[histone H4]-N-methyl-L-lysine(20) N-methyltransferase n=1 Tax=Panagrolaimus davidi TaxID=227884 RepID=A0A914QFG8_9BILA